VTPGRGDQKRATVYFYGRRMEGKVASIECAKHGRESPQALFAQDLIAGFWHFHDSD